MTHFLVMVLPPGFLQVYKYDLGMYTKGLNAEITLDDLGETNFWSSDKSELRSIPARVYG